MGLEAVIGIAFFSWIYYIHSKEQRSKAVNSAIKWAIEDGRIKHIKFSHPLDKEYCYKYSALNDPRNDKQLRKILSRQWMDVMKEREAAGLTQHCSEYKH